MLSNQRDDVTRYVRKIAASIAGKHIQMLHAQKDEKNKKREREREGEREREIPHLGVEAGFSAEKEFRPVRAVPHASSLATTGHTTRYFLRQRFSAQMIAQPRANLIPTELRQSADEYV